MASIDCVGKTMTAQASHVAGLRTVGLSRVSAANPRLGWAGAARRRYVPNSAASTDTVKVAQESNEEAFVLFKEALKEAADVQQPATAAATEPSTPSANPAPAAAESATLSQPMQVPIQADPSVADSPAAASSSFEPSAFDLPDIYPLGKPSQVQSSPATQGPSLSDVFRGLSETVENTVSGIKSSVSGVKDALPELPSPGSGITAAGDAREAVAGSADALLKSLDKPVTALTEDAGKVVSGVTQVVSAATSSASSSIKVGFEGVAGALEGALGPVVEAAQSSGAIVYDALPQPVQQAVGAAGPPLQTAAAYAQDHPAAAAAAAAASVAAPTAGYYYLRFSGYAGDLSPQQTLQLLRNEQAMLIDIRGDEQRASAGVPELRRSARGKAAAVPVIRFEGGTSKRLRGAGDVELLATAAVVAGLSQVNVATKVVFMDNKGELAVRLAKALRREGVSRAYAMSGGFAAWQAAELPVEENNPTYEVSAIEALAEDAEALIEKTQETLVNTPPTTYASVAVGSAALIWSLVNYHTTLQFIGVAGSLGLLVNWFTQFDTPEDALQDLQDKYAKVSGAVRKVAPKQSVSSGSNVSSNVGGGGASSSSVDA